MRRAGVGPNRMRWLEQHQKDMESLLSTVNAVVDFWPAIARPDSQTSRWVEDITAILGVLLERQADHFDVESRSFFYRSLARERADVTPTLERLLAEHPRLRTLTLATRDAVRSFGRERPLETKQTVIDLLATLRRHEEEESKILRDLRAAHAPADVQSPAVPVPALGHDREALPRENV